MQRQQPRTANGSTGANQFLSQAETGYKLGIYAPALATLTPFARFQVTTLTQNGFGEWDNANSLNLSVAQQNTASLRSTLGAELGGSIGLGDTKNARSGFVWAGCMTSPISAGRSRRPSPACRHGLRRDAAARRGDHRLFGQHCHRPGDLDLPSLRRRDWHGKDKHTLNIGARITW